MNRVELLSGSGSARSEWEIQTGNENMVKCSQPVKRKKTSFAPQKRRAKTQSQAIAKAQSQSKIPNHFYAVLCVTSSWRWFPLKTLRLGGVFYAFFHFFVSTQSKMRKVIEQSLKYRGAFPLFSFPNCCQTWPLSSPPPLESCRSFCSCKCSCWCSCCCKCSWTLLFAFSPCSSGSPWQCGSPVSRGSFVENAAGEAVKLETGKSQDLSGRQGYRVDLGSGRATWRQV